jgi:tetratricopeptide (TPR) repeat protein
MNNREMSVSAKAMAPLEEALALYRASGPEGRRGLAWALLWVGDYTKNGAGDPLQAQILGVEALNLFRESGEAYGMAESLQLIAACENDPTRQKEILQEQLAINEAQGDVDGVATTLNFIGYAEFIDGDYENAYTHFAASQEQYRQAGNLSWVAENVTFSAISSVFSGKLARAVLCLEGSLARFREIEQDQQIVMYLFWKGMIALAQGSYDQAAELNEEAGRIAQKTGTPEIFAYVHYSRARLARLRGEAAAAQRYAEEGLDSALRLRSEEMLLLLELGFLALQEGDQTRAGALWREGLQVLIRWRGMFLLTWILDGLAVLAVRTGQLERAARLFGTRQWSGFSHILSPIERAEREADFAEIIAALGQERFEQLREEGRMMGFTQLLALAQEEG